MTDTELLEAILAELEGIALQLVYLDVMVGDVYDVLSSGVQVVRWIFPWALMCSLIYIWRSIWRRLDNVD